MTDETMKPGRRLQEWNEDFDALVYQATGSQQGTVMNTANDPPTIYQVDIDDRSCNCEYDKKSPDDGKVCKHLAKAMLAHPDFTESEELLVRDLSALVDRAAQATRELQNVRDQAQAARQADQAAAVAEAGSDGDEEIDPEALLEAKLESLGLDPDDFEYWIDEDLGSLQFEQDGYLDDDEYSALMDWVTEDDVAVNWDSDEERNYIKEADIPEVLGS